MFSAADYDLLADLIKDSTIIVTPNVLTEVSNLLESFNSFNVEPLGALKQFISKVKEQYLASFELAGPNCFVKFGLPDSSIYELSKKGVVAITIDTDLYAYLLNKGCPVINFNYFKKEN